PGRVGAPGIHPFQQQPTRICGGRVSATLEWSQMKHCPAIALVAVLSLCAPQAAQALSPTVRYAAPGSTNTIGSCPQDDPCRIDYAINNAPASAEVIVAPGTYDVSALPTLTPAATSLDIHGAAGQPRPTITSSIAASTISLSATSTLTDI